MGINIKIIKKSNKLHSCTECLGDIPIGSLYIRGFGYDYDNLQISESVHGKPECFIDWFKSIDIAEPEDYPELKEIIDNTPKILITKIINGDGKK